MIATAKSVIFTMTWNTPIGMYIGAVVYERNPRVPTILLANMMGLQSDGTQS